MPAKINIKQQTWSAQRWLCWLAIPLLLIILVVIITLVHQQPTWSLTELQQQDYWQPQVSWFLAMNNAALALPPNLWYNLTLLGDAKVLLPLAFLGIYLRSSTGPQIGASLWLTLPIGGTLSSFWKSYFAMPRPAVVLDHDTFNIIGEAIMGYNSLPSGHSLTYFAASIAVLATLMSPPQNKKPRNKVQVWQLIAFITFLYLLCLSRVAVGAHWPLDTLAGASLGAIVGLFSAALARNTRKWWQKLYGTKAKFIFVPIYAFLAYTLIQQAWAEPIFAWANYLAIAACCALMYWPWSTSATTFAQQQVNSLCTR